MDKIYLDVVYEGSISCEFGHIIGNQNDPEWKLLIAPCNYHYIYHGKGYCRCVQKECNCFGVEDNCSFPLGRKSFEEI